MLKTLQDFNEIYNKLIKIRIDLVRSANDPEKVRSLAKQLEKLLCKNS